MGTKIIFKSVIIAISLLIITHIGARADQELSWEVSKGSVVKTVYLSGITGSTTYLPVRDLSQTINIPMKWDEVTGSVIWQTYGQSTVITPEIDTVYMVKEGIIPYKSPQKAFYRQGKVYIPARMVELIGIEVWYDQKTLKRGFHIPSNITEASKPISQEKLNLVRDFIIKEKEKIPKKIGSFSTYFNLSYKSRSENLKMAAEALNNALVYSGKTFSFNERVGPRTPDRGYLKAIIFVNKKQVEGYGGGVCQVSTTLYNAVLDAGLRVMERHPHSLPVSYVPKGKDATVNFGTADFKFKNNTANTLMLHAFVDKNKLTVEIFSLPAKGE